MIIKYTILNFTGAVKAFEKCYKHMHSYMDYGRFVLVGPKFPIKVFRKFPEKSEFLVSALAKLADH